MADANSTAQPFHEAFSWLPTEIVNSNSGKFVTRVRDISQGVKTVLEILENSELEKDRDSGRATLNPYDSANLLRFVIAACGLLRDQAEEQCDEMTEEFESSRGDSHE